MFVLSWFVLPRNITRPFLCRRVAQLIHIDLANIFLIFKAIHKLRYFPILCTKKKRNIILSVIQYNTGWWPTFNSVTNVQSARYSFRLTALARSKIWFTAQISRFHHDNLLSNSSVELITIAKKKKSNKIRKLSQVLSELSYSHHSFEFECE